MPLHAIEFYAGIGGHFKFVYFLAIFLTNLP
jgi:hypothetical protein